jgi:Tfp pilus assembly protein PilF
MIRMGRGVLGDMLSKRVPKLISINIAFVVFLTLPSGSAQNVNNDYFAPDRDESLLRIVEAYHLAQANFWAKFHSRDFRGAFDDLKYVLRYFPNHPKALMLMGSLSKLKKTPSLATHYYEKALKLFPQHAFTHAQLGNYLVDIGDFGTGLAKLKEAIEMDPKLALAHAYLAKAYYKIGNPQLARRAAKRARELGYRGKIPGEFKKNRSK